MRKKRTLCLSGCQLWPMVLGQSSRPCSSSCAARLSRRSSLPPGPPIRPQCQARRQLHPHVQPAGPDPFPVLNLHKRLMRMLFPDIISANPPPFPLLHVQFTQASHRILQRHPPRAHRGIAPTMCASCRPFDHPPPGYVRNSSFCCRSTLCGVVLRIHYARSA